MNVENHWDGVVDYVPVEGPWEKVTEKSVEGIEEDEER